MALYYNSAIFLSHFRHKLLVMIKYLFIIIIFLYSFNSNSNENLLTLKQQVERLQREVSDLSKSVFSNKDDTAIQSSDTVTNLSAIDMRIYDLEKDVKNLNANLEEIFFQIEDIFDSINNIEQALNSLDQSFVEIKNKSTKTTEEKNIKQNEDNNTSEEENTLGKLKITTENDNLNNNSSENIDNLEDDVNQNLSPEDQFQLGFDNIREKKWDQAKISLLTFIDNNPENQLSGSAHYWLGELHVLQKDHRDAALIFAEGYQKFPKSIKAPDMLYKLSQSLFEVNKKLESCKTMEKFLIDYPKHKLSKKIKKQIVNYSCLATDE